MRYKAQELDQVRVFRHILAGGREYPEWGLGWVADRFGVSVSTVRRWSSGDVRVSRKYWPILVELLVERLEGDG